MKDKAHILVVDDEVEVCEFLKEFLELKGYTVLTVSSGLEALRDVQEQSFDLVLLDIEMGGMNGLETLRRIRGCDRQLSVIMLTSVQDDEIAKETLREGAQDYLVKPLNLPYLELSILAALAAGQKNGPCAPSGGVEASLPSCRPLFRNGRAPSPCTARGREPHVCHGRWGPPVQDRSRRPS